MNKYVSVSEIEAGKTKITIKPAKKAIPVSKNSIWLIDSSISTSFFI